MPVACWNGVGRILLTGSQAWLACSYFTKAQPWGPDFTHRNLTQVNTYHLLLSSFVRFHVRVKVNSLAFAIRTFCPYSSKFISHVAAAVRLKAALSLQQKSNMKKKRKANPVYKKEKNRKWQDSCKWAASGKECLWFTNDEAKSGIGNHHTLLYL